MNENEKAGTTSGPQRLSDDEFNTSGATPVDADGPGSVANSGQKSGGADALSMAREEAEKFKNEYLYLRAEFENFKKNAIKERADLRKYGAERVISDLLGVLDILETALSTEAKSLVSPEALSNFRKGIEMTAAEFRNTFLRHGVSEVSSHGQPFDPSVHEAVTSEETDAHSPGTVTQVFKKPYKLHDRVIRPGQVVVAKPVANSGAKAKT